MADDETEITRIASALLRSSGHNVEVAKDGQEALEIWKAKPSHYFDLLITDSSMPRLTGLQLIERLRKDKFKARIVVASGLISPEMETAYKAQLVDRIIHKPFRMASLCKVVSELAASSH